MGEDIVLPVLLFFLGDFFTIDPKASAKLAPVELQKKNFLLVQLQVKILLNAPE